jgi:MoaA/NifB/PqqE/SkfB family radical SAM enzyme
MIEWKGENRYNSFNSYKGLTYYEHYKQIDGWLKGENELPPPIEASLDPIKACNHKCYYCNSQRYVDHEQDISSTRRWGKDFIEDTLINLSQWGVKAFCWGGGGEALLNKNLKGMTLLGRQLGMECSIITNGALLDDEYINELMLCRWIGISLDSANYEVYKKVRGVDDCQKVLLNIKKLVQHRTKTDICIKVLVLPETIDTLLYTCEVARDLGVQDFHVRPVDLERKDFKTKQQLELDMAKINGIFEQCHKLETKDFHVYTVTHKYDENFHVKHDFKQCLASPLVTQICTDKKRYVCVDHRLEPRFEVPEWGSSAHRELLLGINPATECARCTWSEYNRQMTEVVQEDRICRNFP